MSGLETLLAVVATALGFGALGLHHRRERDWHGERAEDARRHEDAAAERDRKADERLRSMQTSLAAGTEAMTKHAQDSARYANDVAKAHASFINQTTGESKFDEHHRRIKSLEEWRREHTQDHD